MKNPKIRNGLLTLLFYGLAFVLFGILQKYFTQPMCGPGISFVVIFFLPFITFILFIINLWYYKYRDELDRISSIIIHGLVILFYLIVIIKIS